MSIADKFWGSQQVTRTDTRNRVWPAQWAVAVAVSDAASVARFKRWTSVTIGTNNDGRDAIVAYEVA